MPRLSYNRAKELEVPRTGSAYMPMPEHCGVGIPMLFDGVKHILLRLCKDYCIESKACKVYQFHLDRR